MDSLSHRPDKGEAAQGVAPGDPAFRLNGAWILLVEDKDDLCELFTYVLECYGAHVVAAATAAEALARFQEERPDILVSDIGLPDEDGYALIHKVRALESAYGGHIPALALTAYVGPESRQQALAAGYQAYVPKPVDPLELVAIIVRLLRQPWTRTA